PNGIVKGLLPAVGGDEATHGIDVKEDVVPTLTRQPLAQGKRLGVILARMAQKYARHGKVPRRSSSVGKANSRAAGCHRSLDADTTRKVQASNFVCSGS